MKTKEEIIREAYGDCWEYMHISARKFALKNNGWIGQILEHAPAELDLDFKQMTFRPKSLNGIETNNGWTKIESEADLPKESGLFWIVEDGHIINKPCNYCKATKKWFVECYQYPRHYTLVIVPENNPLF